MPSPGGRTSVDKAADKWSMAFCEFYRDNWNFRCYVLLKHAQLKTGVNIEHVKTLAETLLVLRLIIIIHYERFHYSLGRGFICAVSKFLSIQQTTFYQMFFSENRVWHHANCHLFSNPIFWRKKKEFVEVAQREVCFKRTFKLLSFQQNTEFVSFWHVLLLIYFLFIQCNFCWCLMLILWYCW